MGKDIVPSSKGERIETLDALRGFALFGILLANILAFSGWVMVTDAERSALAGEAGRLWQYRLHHFFVDGKFYTLFSLLFGIGFALQLDRLQRRGADGLSIFRRRVLILLGIGLVHSWLIWDGDILTLYALMGLLLPFFHRWRERALLIVAALLIFVMPVAGMALFRALGWPADLGLMRHSFAIAEALGADADPARVIAWMRRDDFMGWFSWIASGPFFSWGLRIESWRIPKLLGIMLIGIVAGRRLAAGTLLADRRLLWRVLAGGLIVGVPANLGYAAVPGQGQADWPSLIGTVPLALAFAAAFLLAWPRAKPVLGWFAAPGRMALTNYLAQSLICVTLFMGVGFGLAGRLGPVGLYGVAVAIFAAQTLFSHWWLARHAQGPMEKLWRRLTYWRSEAPMRGPAAL